MPHFVIDCASSVLDEHDEMTINKAIHKVAHSTDLFVESDIKVRVNPFDSYLVGNKQEPFIHVFTHIMQGRTTEQKAALSKAVVTMLNDKFPEVANIAMNINDFEKATYCNKAQL
ncbi:5-carboxymethyl-2-hydroxymuconate Delta-isomerase [Pseudoalteromonas sp. SaAl2]